MSTVTPPFTSAKRCATASNMCATGRAMSEPATARKKSRAPRLPPRSSRACRNRRICLRSAVRPQSTAISHRSCKNDPAYRKRSENAVSSSLGNLPLWRKRPALKAERPTPTARGQSRARLGRARLCRAGSAADWLDRVSPHQSSGSRGGCLHRRNSRGLHRIDQRFDHRQSFFNEIGRITCLRHSVDDRAPHHHGVCFSRCLARLRGS